jgi:hypothetical protein
MEAVVCKADQATDRPFKGLSVVPQWIWPGAANVRHLIVTNIMRNSGIKCFCIINSLFENILMEDNQFSRRFPCFGNKLQEINAALKVCQFARLSQLPVTYELSL